MSRRSGLGKGLSSLIPASEVADGGEGAIFAEVPTASVAPNPNQPRVHFSEEGLVELAETRRLDGRTQRKAKVFLAEKKSIFGIEMTTIWYCRSSLLILTALLLALATYLLKLSLSRY